MYYIESSLLSPDEVKVVMLNSTDTVLFEPYLTRLQPVGELFSSLQRI